MPEACEARAIGGVHERLSDATVGIVRFKDDELVDDIFELKKADLQKVYLAPIQTERRPRSSTAHCAVLPTLVHYTLVAGAAPKAVERPGWVLVVACLQTPC